MLARQVVQMAQDYFELAYEFQMHGELERALYYYQRSLDCMPSPEAYTFMAWTVSMDGDYETAIEICTQRIRRPDRSICSSRSMRRKPARGSATRRW